MRIEVLEDRLKAADPESGQHYNLTKGDIVTVSDACGTRWCGLGWVKDVAGKVKSAERKPGAEVLVVQKKTIASRGRIRG